MREIENPHGLDEIFGRSTDDKGHSERLQVRMPPMMARAISVTVMYKGTPYETNSDFIRDAVWHRLADWAPYLDTHETSDALARLNVMRELIRAEELNTRTLEVINDLEAIIHKQPDRAAKVKLLSGVFKSVEAISDPSWRSYLTNMFVERYGHIYSGKSDKSE